MENSVDSIIFEEQKGTDRNSNIEIVLETRINDADYTVPNLSLPPVFLADVKYKFPTALPLFTNEQQIKIVQASILSKKICWLSIIDCILVSFILYFNYYALFVIIFLPIIGFIGSRKYNFKLCVLYFVYLILIIVLRVTLLILLFGVPILIIQFLIILLELYLAAVDYKFLRILNTLTMEERDHLLGRFRSPLDEPIPEGVAVKVLESPPLVYKI
jgi:hypothetical protein